MAILEISPLDGSAVDMCFISDSKLSWVRF